MFGFLKLKGRSSEQETGGPEEGSGITVYIVSAMASVALADGRLTQKEKETLVQSTKRGLLSPSEILDQVEQMISMLLEGGEPLLHEIFSGGHHLPAESKRIVVDAAAKMSFMDGEPGPKEMELTAKIAFWIGMDKQDFEKWAREVQHEIDSHREKPS